MSVTDQLNQYLESWNLSKPQPLAQTVTSHIYTVELAGETVILKLLTEVGEEERVGALALAYFDGLGAVRLLRADQGAHLLEYAEGQDLIPMVTTDDKRATEIIADVLNQLHTLHAQPFPAGLVPLRRWFQALFAQAENDEQAGIYSVYRRGAALAQFLLDNPLDEGVLHGDMHHGNVRYREGRGWLAFDPKGIYGERTYDAANVLCNPIELPEVVQNEKRLLRNANILAAKLEIERGRILQFLYAYAALSAAWFVQGGDEVGAQHDLNILAIIEPHVGLV
jgi:streptomycin 6-kinase